MFAGPFTIASASLKAWPLLKYQQILAIVHHYAQQDRERIGLWGPFALAFGAALYFLPQEEPALLLGPIFTVLCVLLALSWRRVATLRRISLWGSAIIGIGFSLAAAHSHLTAAPVLERTGYYALEGVVSRVELRPTRPRVLIEITDIENLPSSKTPAKVRITVSKAATRSLQLGEEISVRAYLRPPQGPSYPGGFDFRRWAWFEQLGATGYAVGVVSNPSDTTERGEQSDAWAASLREARAYAASRLRLHLKDQTAAVAIALTVGDRSGLDRDTTAAMRDSGLAHLLAISGLHIGLVASTIFFLIRMGLVLFSGPSLGAHAKKLAAFCALMGAFAYLLLSGAPPPTQRAFVMTGLVLIAVIFDRRAISMRLVALAVCVVIFWRPDSVIGASFQLSFAAVIGLVAVYEWLGQSYQMQSDSERATLFSTPLVKYGIGVAATTVIASLATAPFVLHHFGRLAVYGVAANLFAVPIVAFLVMPAGLIGLLLIPFGLEGPAILLMGFGIDLVLSIAHFFAALDGSHITLPTSPGWALLLTIFGGLWCAIWQAPWRRWGIVPLSIGLIAGFAFSERPILFIDAEKAAFLFRESTTTRVFFHTGGVRERDRLSDAQISRDLEGFLPSQWSRPMGIDPKQLLHVEDNRVSSDAITCDDLGCVIRLSEITQIAIAHDLRAYRADCRLAEILFLPTAPIPRGTCKGPRIVKSFFDFRRDGSYAVWDSNPLKVEPAIRYGRLWSPAPE